MPAIDTLPTASSDELRPEPLFSVAALARAWGKSEPWVREQIRKGRIEGVKLSWRTLRVRATEVERFLAQAATRERDQ
jgi:hypothetical protein